MSEEKKASWEQEIGDEDSKKSEIEPATILSKFGFFQIRSLFFISLMFFSFGVTALAPVFINIVPDYTCRQNKTDNSRNYFNVSQDSDRCSRLVLPEDDLSSDNSSLLREHCLDGWNFNLTEGNNVVTQFGLVCESTWKRPLTTSSIFFGMFLANIYGGQISDKYGRKISALVAILVNVVVLIALSFSPSYWFYICFLVLHGFATSLNFMYVFVWGQELVYTSDKRVLATFIINLGHASGNAMMSLVGYLVREWSWVYRVFAAMHAMCFLLLWTVPESPIWLLESLHSKKALKVLKQIAKTNKIDLTRTKINLQEKEYESRAIDQASKRLSSKLLWQNKTLRRRLIISCLLWVYTLLSFFTMTLNSSNLGGNVYINNLIGGGFDVLAAIAITVILKKFCRRHTMVFLLAMFGSFSILSQLVKQASEPTGTAFALISRCFSTAATMMVFLITGEYFPTLLRNTSVSIASLCSRIGSMMAPFLIFAGEEINLSIPFYVMGSLSVGGIYLTLLLPETSHLPLPNTLKDSLDINDPRWIPCLNSQSNAKEQDPSSEKKLPMSAHVVVNEQAV